MYRSSQTTVETEMKTVSMPKAMPHGLLLLMTAGLLMSGPLPAQVPVDENGDPIEAIDEGAVPTVDSAAPASAEEENLTAEELQALVGPIALYPDDLLAIVLPASAYPLQIVEAARFLERLGEDESLEPDESWETSVIALLNYPEVIELMNEDIDWTYELGEAVVRQQADVIAAVETFRDRAYAAGNLESDDHQTVSNDEGVIEIQPVEDDVIYVPYYEPERVVVYQTQPVYHYYPQPYPVYYYPYPYGYSFASDYFWGVTTAFRIGWATQHLRVFHHSYWGHPYYGRQYFGHYYRRPSIGIYNSWYVNNHVRRSLHHYRDGDFWRPRRHSGARPGHNRSRADYYLDARRDGRRERSEDGYRNRQGDADVRHIATGNSRHAGRRAGFNGDRTDSHDRASVAEPERQADDDSRATPDRDTIRFRPRARTADNDVIRFRTREQVASRATPERVDRDAATSRSRSSNETVTPPSTDRRAVIRSHNSRRDTAARPRTASPSHSRRSPATSPAERRVQPRANPPRSLPQPRASQPRASRPSQPGVSQPRVSQPRASQPGATSRPTPSPENRSTTRRAESSTSHLKRRNRN